MQLYQKIINGRNSLKCKYEENEEEIVQYMLVLRSMILKGLIIGYIVCILISLIFAYVDVIQNIYRILLFASLNILFFFMQRKVIRELLIKDILKYKLMFIFCDFMILLILYLSNTLFPGDIKHEIEICTVLLIASISIVPGYFEKVATVSAATGTIFRLIVYQNFMIKDLIQDSFKVIVVVVFASIINYCTISLKYYEIERKKALKKENQLDLLTGLYNRKYLKKVFTSKAKEFKCALILLDLDNFKEVNDSLGHQMGDELLKDVALRIRKCFRQTDITARLGGDEFVILMFNISDNNIVIEKIQKLLKALKITVQNEDKAVTISASVGCSFCEPKERKSFEKMYEEADQAMYRVKGKGKSGYALFENSISINR